MSQLEFLTKDGYVFYLNHLISGFIIFFTMLYASIQLNKGHWDKFLHVFVSFILTALYIWLINIQNLFICPWWIAPIIVLIIGILKEVIDLITKKKFDLLDLLADFIGTTSMTLFYLISFIMHNPKY